MLLLVKQRCACDENGSPVLCPPRTPTLRLFILPALRLVEPRSPIPASQPKCLCIRERYLSLCYANRILLAPVAGLSELLLAGLSLCRFAAFFCFLGVVLSGASAFRFSCCCGFVGMGTVCGLRLGEERSGCMWYQVNVSAAAAAACV
jgi:hypothetical protein